MQPNEDNIAVDRLVAMDAVAAERVVFRGRVLVGLCAIITAGIGFIALLGWLLDQPVLASLGSGRIPVAPSTAAMFVLFAFSLYLRSFHRASRKAYWTGTVINVSGGLVALILFVFSIQGHIFDVEHLGLAIPHRPGESPLGHMSQVSAICFLLSSCSYLLSLPSLGNRNWTSNLAWCLACCIIAIGATLILAYIYGEPVLYRTVFIPPALLTSIALIALGAGLLALAKPKGWQSLSSKGSSIRASSNFLLVFVFLAVGFIIAGFLYYRSYESRYRLEMENQLAAIGELKAIELLNWRQERLGDGAVIYKNANFSGLCQRYLEKPTDLETIRRLHIWLQKMQEAFQYNRVFLVNGNGVECLSVPSERQPVSGQLITGLAEASRTKQVVFQDFYRDENDGRIYLAVLVPILAEPDRDLVLATLVLRIDPKSYLFPFLNRWPTPSKSAETLLVRQDGENVLFLNELKFQKNAALSLHRSLAQTELPAAQGVLGRRGIIEGRDYRNVPVIADLRQVPDSPWVLVSRMDLAETYEPLREKLWLMVILVVALVTGAGAFVGLIWRRQHEVFYREQYDASEALRESEEKFKTLFNAADDAIFTMNHTYFLDCNVNTEKVFGCSKERIIGHSPVEFSPEKQPDGRLSSQSAAEKIAAAFAGQPQFFEWVHTHLDGTPFYAEVSLNRVYIGKEFILQAIVRDISERKRAAELLLATQDLLNQTEELGRVGGWQFDIETKLQNWTKTVYDIHELDFAAQLTVEQGVSYYTPASQAVIKEAVQRAIEQGESFDLELEIITAKGNRRSVHVFGRPDPARRKISGFIQDITERKEAERALREVSEFNRQITMSAQEGIVVYGQDLKYLGWNPFMEKLTGVSAAEVLGRHPLEVFPFLFEAGVIAGVEKALAGEVSEAERLWFHIPQTGRSGWASEIRAPLRNGVGEIIGVIANVRDITEHVQSEEELLVAGRQWSASFDAMADGVSIHNVDHTILNANLALLELLGKRPDEVIGRKCFQVFHGKECPIGNCPLHETRETKKPASVEIFEPALGKLLHISTAPIIDEAGKLRRVVHTVRDLTDQRKIENQLHQSQKMEAIGTLAGGIAHDFNNILTAILGFGEIVLEALPEGSPLREEQGHVVAAGKRAKELVKQILTFSRRNEQEMQPLMVQFVVKEALKLLRASIPTSIAIREDIDVNCGLVMADPGQIHQLVMNLCTNAYLAMRESGGEMKVSLNNVGISAEKAAMVGILNPGPHLCLEVSDNGCGMDRTVRERIFEPYFTTRAQGEGSGLGLSLVHGIVTGLGGAISVYSEPGLGTTFKIYLPLITGVTTVHQPEEEVVAPPGGNESILLVDDEESLARLERKILEGLGYRVTAFDDSLKALQSFRDKPDDFDLILTDMTMPGLNGSELAREVMRIRPGKPVILCTGFSEVIDAEKAKDLGISVFMLKPLTKFVLAKAIRRALDGEHQ